MFQTMADTFLPLVSSELPDSLPEGVHHNVQDACCVNLLTWDYLLPVLRNHPN